MKHLKTLLGKGFNPGVRGLLAAALAVTGLGLAAAPASAATVVVNTTTDQSLGSCSGSCSLRDAVATANPGDTIQVPAGHYVLTLGDIISETSLTIAGAGARSTSLDGNGASRIFQFPNSSGTQTVELDDLSLIHGLAATPDSFSGLLAGGALVGEASLTLRRCRLAGNQAELGGAVFWQGSLTIDQCTIADNLATSVLFGSSGGGIFVVSTANFTTTNSTLTGNTASAGSGGGLSAINVIVNLNNVTVTANQAPSGGGIDLPFADWTIVNTIVADNLGGDCLLDGGASFTTDHSLDSDNSCLLTGPGDLPGVAPLLGPLANNGGPTDTHALLAGSPALDAGNNATCLATDQRGVTRPQGPACDIGAFEVFVPPTPQAQIAALTAQINALVTGGALAPNKANPLINKLDQVTKKLDKGQTNAACGQLGAFINEVNADIHNGTLTAAQGQALINAANAIEANIGC